MHQKSGTIPANLIKHSVHKLEELTDSRATTSNQSSQCNQFQKLENKLSSSKVHIFLISKCQSSVSSQHIRDFKIPAEVKGFSGCLGPVAAPHMGHLLTP